MSRAVRRHPPGKGKGRRQQPARPAAVRPSMGPRPPRDAAEGRSLSGLLRPRWASDIIGELRKVTWPTREETQSLTVVVVIVAAAFGVFLGGIDMFFNWAIDNTLFR